MNTSVIRYRVADFLKTHAPFDAIPAQHLIELAGQGRVKFHESDEYIFRQGQAKTAWVWIVQQGRIELIDESSGSGQLRDVLGEGDLLGLDRFLGDGSCILVSARTTSDVIIYALDAAAFEDLAVRQPAVKRYLAAHSRWAERASAAAPQAGCRGSGTGALLRARESGLDKADIFAILAPFTTRCSVREMVTTRSEALAVDANAILTASDLALFCDRNPALLLRLIREASGIAELAPLLPQGGRMVLDGLAQSSDVEDCARIATEIVAAAAASCIRFAHQDAVSAGIEPPPVRFCWLAFGAMARGEVLRLTAPRIGVVYDDESLQDPSVASLYFNAVAGQMSAWFDRCGLAGAASTWPEGIHPCMPLSEWKRVFSATVRKPYEHDLFARRELFDLRELSGDSALLGELTRYIAQEMAQTDSLVPLLANDTLAHLPPLTVFHGLVLTSDGSEREALDLAELVLNPISNAARVFVLGQGEAPIDTFERLAAAEIHFPEHHAIFRDAGDAFRVGLYHQAIAGTSLLPASALGKFDQRVMKTAFSSILRLLELTSSTFFSRA